MEVQINEKTVAVIKSLFAQMRDGGWQDIVDASIYMYDFVRNEGIYPVPVVNGFYSAMVIISALSMRQFLMIKSIFV